MTHYPGPIPPNAPTLLSSVVGPTHATISWVVTAVAYTPERYSIVYSMHTADLDMRSNFTEGSSNYSNINQAYSVTIADLEPFTQYYYAVVAQNSFTTTESSISTFKTAEAGIIEVNVLSLLKHLKLYIACSTYSTAKFLLCCKHWLKECHTLMDSSD